MIFLLNVIQIGKHFAIEICVFQTKNMYTNSFFNYRFRSQFWAAILFIWAVSIRGPVKAIKITEL